MTEEDGRISRRRVLGALGGIGAAGAFGGGTSALFWDEEVFGNVDVPNVLAAGNLNLQVDWTEHYADWRGAETEVEGVRMVDSLADVQEGETPLPYPEDPLLAVDDDTLDEFMAATVTESSGMTDDPDPVVTLEDVKPGDFGEVTLSYHLTGNPGYVSLCSNVVADSDNGYTEPEDAVDGSQNGSDGTEGGDLGDLVQAAAWYDPDCNNMYGGAEVEVMLVTDASESMTKTIPGTPNVDDDPGDQDADGNDTALEAVRGGVGDGAGDGFLTALASGCGDAVEVGSVSAATNLHHLDDLSDGDDPGAGFDGEDLDVNLDKGLLQAGGSGYGQLKQLYGPGTDFSPDWTTDDPTTANYEAERPYTEDGGSSVPQGVQRAHRALIPDGMETSIPDGGGGFLDGIDPTGNADDPGDVRKLMVVFTDGAFTEGQDDPVAFAEEVATRAGEDGIDIAPVLVNDDPKPTDVEFAQALTTNGQRYYVTHYDAASAPSECPQAITDAGETCTSMLQAMDSLQTNICATAGAEEVLAGPASLDSVLGQLDECRVLDPTASGATASDEFGASCHGPGSGGCVALAWWLPRDIPGVDDNIVQTDRYEFTLGFKAEQCRHNTSQS